MVRLLRGYVTNISRGDDGFQSHYGAIATTGHDGVDGAKKKFQSHYGAIATHLRALDAAKLAASFNPTMVRLLHASS